MYKVFRPSVEGSTKGTSPECAAGPRDVPKVDPDTRGQENPISMSTDESIGITFCVWTIMLQETFSETLYAHFPIKSIN